MKKLTLLSLLIPILSFSQQLSLSDLYKINSPISFEKVCKDNGYDFLKKNSKYIQYTLNYKQVVGQRSGMLLDTADTWLHYNIKHGRLTNAGSWYVQISTPKDGSLNIYDLILSEVKNQCYYSRRLSNGWMHEGVCYECPNPNFRSGKICFKVYENIFNADRQMIVFMNGR